MKTKQEKEKQLTMVWADKKDIKEDERMANLMSP